jgi:sensor histidine kinase YesM
MIVMVLIVLLVVVSFNFRLTHPITKMADAFDSAAKGDFDAKLKFGYKNEITVIQDHYNNMLDEIKKLTGNLLQSQQQLHETEMDKQMFQLNALQSQINAHFLYNVLHSIRGMSLSNAKKEVAIAIDNLVSYFRYITRTDEYVLLYKELEHLERYIAIQKIRFGDRLQFKVFTDPTLRGQSIVKLILQPLVENALFHGLEGKNGRWLIRIKAVVQDDQRLIIKVLDNGMGMSDEKVASLHEELRGNGSSSSSEESLGQGIGLVNIHKRIQIYYGEPYGLTIKSWHNRGTLVTIKVPLRDKEGHSNV